MPLTLAPTNKVSIWSVEVGERSSKIQFSTSRKLKENEARIDEKEQKSGYRNEGWFGVLVGEAQKKAGQLKQSDRIVLTNAIEKREPYLNKDTGKKEYPKNSQIVIFDFEFAETSKQSSSPMDTAPKVAQNEDDIPW